MEKGKITINEVINLQNSDGSWSEDKLIELLAKSEKGL